MKQYKVTFTGGATPLLMHADHIQWADNMEAWIKDPKNKGKSKNGDDRTPPWRWIGCLNYTDPVNGVVSIPNSYIMAAIMKAATAITLKGMKTFKNLSQCCISVEESEIPLLVGGKQIQMADINKAKDLETFNEQNELSETLGFSLHVKRARIKETKHIRVRPRFYNWSLDFKLFVTNDLVTKAVLQQILSAAGEFSGLGDWRPGCKTPGPFGTFTAVVK